MKKLLLFLLLGLTNLSDSKPRVSIITSIYKGDAYIEEFLADITRQTIFKQCELLLINANSPGREEKVIREYLKRYKNIMYWRLDRDPGLYAVWNLGIKRARADFITNANLDDKRNPQCLEMHAQFLERNSTIDVVFSDYYVTNTDHETFERHTLWMFARPKVVGVDTLSINECGFGPQPMWRKNIHEKYGLFDERFLIAGDLEFAIRVQLRGSKFGKAPGISGLYYNNPNGLSTAANDKRTLQQQQEHKFIEQNYVAAWNAKFANKN